MIDDKELAKQNKCQQLEIWSMSKEILALDWIDNEDKLKKRYLNQGEIYSCELGENIGHEQAKERPVLILSANRYNKNGLITVAPLTSTIKLNPILERSPMMKTHYVLRKEKYPYLVNDSTVLVENVRTVSSVRLSKYIGRIEDTDISAIKIRLKTLFDL